MDLTGNCVLGGGYLVYAKDSQIRLAWDLVDCAERKGIKLAVLVLAYGNSHLCLHLL